jgi:Mg/Co/Ni transporter MgtE
MTVQEAFDKFRMDAHDVEIVYYIYILEGEKLIGITTLKDMLLSSPEVHLSEIMQKKLKTVSPDERQQAVAEIISKYNLLAIPVVHEDGDLLGVITVDDVVDILLPHPSRKKRRGI